MDKLQLVRMAKRVADIAFEFASPQVNINGWLEDRRKEGINPFYDQTETGLVFEVYYGIPGKIWTPWGYWGCWGSGAGRYPMDKFLPRIGAVLHKEKYVTDMGEYGPIYLITKVDGIELPPLKMKAERDYIPYHEAKKEWEDLFKLA